MKFMTNKILGAGQELDAIGASAATASHAICLAALKAVESKGEE